ncbi:hypothetical protein CEXT_453771 [Caerostris extrusa]|uniref:Uncharacterized protein n=1 Tax=Caerostris extrusa TaxID=172846 RepID=A0AAV4TFC7_CAEEX|nr:hypothetical protein CEXT_453771 [Caerostris extrusa]
MENNCIDSCVRDLVTEWPLFSKQHHQKNANLLFPLPARCFSLWEGWPTGAMSLCDFPMRMCDISLPSIRLAIEKKRKFTEKLKAAPLLCVCWRDMLQ